MMAPVRLDPNGDWTWDSRALFVVLCNVPYKVVVTRGDGCNGPCAKLVREFSTGSGTGGVEYPLTRVECGCGYAIFGSGDREICTAPQTCGGPCANTFRLKVSAGNAAFTVAGWYSIRACGSDNCYAEELEEADATDQGIEILAGPFDTEAEAAAECGPVTVFCSSGPDRSFSRAPKAVTFTGDLAALGTVELAHIGAGHFEKRWEPGYGPTSPCGPVVAVELAWDTRYCRFRLYVFVAAGGEANYTWQYLVTPSADMPLAFDTATDDYDQTAVTGGCAAAHNDIGFTISEA